jgi:hypothetical protein
MWCLLDDSIQHHLWRHVRLYYQRQGRQVTHCGSQRPRPRVRNCIHSFTWIGFEECRHPFQDLPRSAHCGPERSAIRAAGWVRWRILHGLHKVATMKGCEHYNLSGCLSGKLKFAELTQGAIWAAYDQAFESSDAGVQIRTDHARRRPIGADFGVQSKDFLIMR